MAVDNGTVRYYRNNAVVYSSGVGATTPLVVDASLESIGATVQVVAAGRRLLPHLRLRRLPPRRPSGSELRVLQWNIHHGGYGTDGVYSTERVAAWVAR